MIARIWRGLVPTHKADAYFDRMLPEAVPDYQSWPGNLGVWCLRRQIGDAVEVTMLTLWRDVESIAVFAGETPTKAKYYDFDTDYLVTLPESVEHHQVVGIYERPA